VQRLITDLVAFNPQLATYAYDNPTGCPAGFVNKFAFDGRLINSSTTTFSDLEIEVTALTEDDVLQNADTGPAGVGARHTVPQSGAFTDGLLTTGEFVDDPLAICIKKPNPFRFHIDVWGVPE
jgi:hypothetical protein